MAGLGNPAYSKSKVIIESTLQEMSFNEILFSYIIIKARFKFPSDLKYPSIPCFLDETTTVYPLEGEGILTGAEYLLAKSQDCELKISEIFYIPFEKEKIIDFIGDKQVDRYEEVNHPFKEIISDIQSKRRKHPKGSINNLLYKEMGNSIYGTVVRGISDKKRFDIKSGKTQRMMASEMSNPILAS